MNHWVIDLSERQPPLVWDDVFPVQTRSVELEIGFGDALTLMIRDDGRGVPARVAAGIGIQSMRWRADELGGSFVVAGRPTGGTEVSVCLPTGSL